MSQPTLMSLEKRIYTIRGMQVMLDSELAEIYQVETKVFNQAVKRNKERFPESFRFQLTEAEYAFLRSQFSTLNDATDLTSQIATSSSQDSLRSQTVTLENGRGKHRKYLPYVFTEQGVAMLSAVLKSETAIQTSIQIINAFVSMRQFFAHNANLFNRLDMIEKRQLGHEAKTDEKFEQLFNALENKNTPPKQGIFFDGQIYDAYTFVADIIRSAQKSIDLIDNYLDDTVLTLLSKKQANVAVRMFTKTVTPQLKQDIEKFNTQYPSLKAEQFDKAHDRFLIIDQQTVYHFGASLKDLGKKWFAFSKMDIDVFQMLERLNA
jgi:hypothetical protein